ncbi:LysR substrate-binding domain-containing protein (plasmid) [Klebsiella michiganensis]|uniref:LysR substrate-binding domain-containing protein n=1 Tax=Klebsiella michiganensis TaxID=1134687 RepID=UPI00265B0C31|nr:LysR substrate-binding domain-containing protein [Klebsiella michiganensis]WKJ95785.1 LysR substrate-binding domain-containing protein [Klebsiella michiganensis]WKK01076.1 LysR substrate-binding domain-containing protein [Klebsiella michiganensis]WKK02869.1 LysR substrate-binding domain-containing protein [Klebsiella michiganensis]WKK07009.1 LysR substrate-binding domain-containing protein [Klebsiella michiganensis]
MSDLKQLYYFITLAECLHYGKAAKALSISQPPLSRQIASLEDKLEVKLFTRHHYGVSLTEAGRMFYIDSRAVINAYELACLNVRKMATGEKGKLSVGFMMHAAYSTLPELTKRIVKKFPDLHLILQEVTPATLVDAVLEGKYDVGLVFNPGPVRYLKRLTLRCENLCLAVNEAHLLADENKVNVSKLRNEPLIATPHSVAPVLREMINLYLRQGGVEPYYRLETHLQQTIISLVAEGVGVALVPESVKKLNYAGVKYLELEHSPTIEQVIVWHQDNSNPALNSFTQLAKEVAVMSSTG